MRKKCRRCGVPLQYPGMNCPYCGYDENYKSYLQILKDKYNNSFAEEVSGIEKFGYTLVFIFIICMVIYIIVMSLVLFVPWSNGFDVHDVYLDNAETFIVDRMDGNYIDEDSDDRYYYYVSFTLHNFSTSLDGSQLLIYYYNDGNLVGFDNSIKQNNPINYTLNRDEIELDGESYRIGFSRTSRFVEVTDIKVIIMHDGEKILENRIPFNMNDVRNHL